MTFYFTLTMAFIVFKTFDMVRYVVFLVKLIMKKPKQENKEMALKLIVSKMNKKHIKHANSYSKL